MGIGDGACLGEPTESESWSAVNCLAWSKVDLRAPSVGGGVFLFGGWSCQGDEYLVIGDCPVWSSRIAALSWASIIVSFWLRLIGRVGVSFYVGGCGWAWALGIEWAGALAPVLGIGFIIDEGLKRGPVGGSCLGR